MSCDNPNCTNSECPECEELREERQEREKGDDDGVEYGDPRDYRDGLE